MSLNWCDTSSQVISKGETPSLSSGIRTWGREEQTRLIFDFIFNSFLIGLRSCRVTRGFLSGNCCGWRSGAGQVRPITWSLPASLTESWFSYYHVLLLRRPSHYWVKKWSDYRKCLGLFCSKTHRYFPNNFPLEEILSDMALLRCYSFNLISFQIALTAYYQLKEIIRWTNTSWLKNQKEFFKIISIQTLLTSIEAQSFRRHVF